MKLKNKNVIGLIHGDLSLDNIVWNENNQKLGILDFSDRNISDIAYDFSELFKLDDEFVKSLISHYPYSERINLFKLAKTYYLLRPLLRIHSNKLWQNLDQNNLIFRKELNLLKDRVKLEN